MNELAPARAAFVSPAAKRHPVDGNTLLVRNLSRAEAVWVGLCLNTSGCERLVLLGSSVLDRVGLEALAELRVRRCRGRWTGSPPACGTRWMTRCARARRCTISEPRQTADERGFPAGTGAPHRHAFRARGHDPRELAAFVRGRSPAVRYDAYAREGVGPMTPRQAEELLAHLKLKALGLDDLHERARLSGSVWKRDQLELFLLCASSVPASRTNSGRLTRSMCSRRGFERSCE